MSVQWDTPELAARMDQVVVETEHKRALQNRQAKRGKKRGELSWLAQQIFGWNLTHGRGCVAKARAIERRMGL